MMTASPPEIPGAKSSLENWDSIKPQSGSGCGVDIKLHPHTAPSAVTINKLAVKAGRIIIWSNDQTRSPPLEQMGKKYHLPRVFVHGNALIQTDKTGP